MRSYWNSVTSAFEPLRVLSRDLLLRTMVSFVLLSLITPIATQWYAFKYGARLPLEGSPFSFGLFLTTSCALTLVSISSLIVPTLLRLILVPLAVGIEVIETAVAKSFATTAKRIGVFVFSRGEPGHQTTDAKQSRLIRWAAVVFNLAQSALFLFLELVFYITWVGVAGFVMYRFFWISISNNAPPEFYLLSLLVGAQVVAIIIFLRRPDSVDRLISIAGWVTYLIALTLLLIGMFSSAFETGLRLAHYGGGVPVKISSTNDLVIEDAHLFLVSDQSTTVWSASSNRFYEYDNNQIVFIEYPDSNRWRLPERSPPE